MNESKDQLQEFDPSLAVLDFYDDLARSWSSAMSRTVASHGFAELLGWQMQVSFGMASWVRRRISGLVSFSLRQVNIPTRAEMLSLAERFTQLEMAVDDLDVKLDEIQAHLRARPPSQSVDQEEPVPPPATDSVAEN